MSKNTPIVTFEEWLASAIDMSGKGISSDETYPLSTYNPISKEYINMLQSHYEIHKDTLSSYGNVHESYAKFCQRSMMHYRSLYVLMNDILIVIILNKLSQMQLSYILMI